MCEYDVMIQVLDILLNSGGKYETLNKLFNSGEKHNNIITMTLLNSREKHENESLFSIREVYNSV